MKPRDQLAQIESQVAQCEALIARQHEIIRNAQQKGRDASSLACCSLTKKSASRSWDASCHRRARRPSLVVGK
jgi:hypothetical protein